MAKKSTAPPATSPDFLSGLSADIRRAVSAGDEDSLVTVLAKEEPRAGRDGAELLLLVAAAFVAEPAQPASPGHEREVETWQVDRVHNKNNRLKYYGYEIRRKPS